MKVDIPKEEKPKEEEKAKEGEAEPMETEEAPKTWENAETCSSMR